MLLNRIPVYIALIICLLVSVTLFHIKDNVMALKIELKEVKRQVQYEQDTIHILKAEITYLSSPERLRKLAENYLTLQNTKVAQMITDPLIENQINQNSPVLKPKSFAENTKWRYKKGPTRYLTTGVREKVSVMDP